jgi:hypothetical protein
VARLEGVSEGRTFRMREVAGHASVSFTDSRYGHLQPEHLRDAAEAMRLAYGAGERCSGLLLPRLFSSSLLDPRPAGAGQPRPAPVFLPQQPQTTVQMSALSRVS